MDDFYTKCHALYGETTSQNVLPLLVYFVIGIESVVTGLSTSIKLRAHTAAQIGCA